MASVKDLTGQRFGRLTVVKRGENLYYGKDRQEKPAWICQCDCGAVKLVPGQFLRTGRVKSCGCSRGEFVAECCREKIKRGERVGRMPKNYRPYEKTIRDRYYAMLRRCYCTDDKSYRNYGERGIAVCELWQGEDGFENFYSWSINNGFSPKLLLDRTDNNKGYSPDNCRWITFLEQQNNKRNNVNIEINGETHSMADWSRILGINYKRLSNLHVRSDGDARVKNCIAEVMRGVRS